MNQVEHQDLTVAELASMCRVHVSTVRRWILMGRVSAIRLPGGYYRIPASVVAALRSPSSE